MKKRKGFTAKNQDSKDPALAGGIHHQQGKGYKSGGLVGGAGSGSGRLARSRQAAKVPAKTEL